MHFVYRGLYMISCLWELDEMLTQCQAPRSLSLLQALRLAAAWINTNKSLWIISYVLCTKCVMSSCIFLPTMSVTLCQSDNGGPAVQLSWLLTEATRWRSPVLRLRWCGLPPPLSLKLKTSINETNPFRTSVQKRGSLNGWNKRLVRARALAPLAIVSNLISHFNNRHHEMNTISISIASLRLRGHKANNQRVQASWC